MRKLILFALGTETITQLQSLAISEGYGIIEHVWNNREQEIITIKGRGEVTVIASPRPWSSAPPPREQPRPSAFWWWDSNLSAFRFLLITACSCKPSHQLIPPPLLLQTTTMAHQGWGTSHPLLQVFQSQTCQSHLLIDLDVELRMKGAQWIIAVFVLSFLSSLMLLIIEVTETT